MDSRNYILNKISAAIPEGKINTAAGSIASDAMAEKLAGSLPKENDKLWDKFKEELEKISGEYYSAAGYNEAKMILQSLLRGTNRIAVDGSSYPEDFFTGHDKNNIEIVKTTDLSSNERKTKTAETEWAIVTADYAIADISSLVFMPQNGGTSYPHFLCRTVIALIKKDNIFSTQFELFQNVPKDKLKNMFFVTGPSRTADIEKILVLGAHGPARLVVISI